ncbi:hypothetical protein EOD41_04370 [Mucilaginibacter limnophilus]|uniref:Lipoprotein n=1 Tax=Mucilaginibacter limnophilus TaxID=1932778 RepID=A0A437MU91_9SPHI|nr:hypothetical protein [Mucilaginibacter limnophilus]RVU01207.1 hypothetical protein EOD41_04370 [Mucilaginibacter limnophilus]
MNLRQSFTTLILSLFISACADKNDCINNLQEDPEIGKHAGNFTRIANAIIGKRVEVITAFTKKHPEDTSEIYGSIAVWKGYLKPDSLTNQALNSLDKPGVGISYVPALSEIRYQLHRYECSDSIMLHAVTNKGAVFPGKVKIIPLGSGWTYMIHKEVMAGGY